MGLNVKELTKPSVLVSRAGVRPVAVDTTRRPQDAAAGTQAHEDEVRAKRSGGDESNDSPRSTLDTTA